MTRLYHLSNFFKSSINSSKIFKQRAGVLSVKKPITSDDETKLKRIFHVFMTFYSMIVRGVIEIYLHPENNIIILFGLISLVLFPK